MGTISRSGRSTGEGNGNPLQYSYLETPMDREAWQATVHGVARVRHNLATKLPPPRSKKESKQLGLCYSLLIPVLRVSIDKQEVQQSSTLRSTKAQDFLLSKTRESTVTLKA